MSLDTLARRVLETALKSPYEAKSLLAQHTTDVGTLRPLVQFLEIPHHRLWADPVESIIHETSDELIRIFKNKQSDSADRFDLYLYMNNSRVLNLVREMRRLRTSGTVIEIGSLAGSFALVLQRLGYRVTAVDRYESKGGIYEPNIALMEQAGVTVVSTSPDTEEEKIRSLGTFDFVISMAVIEHVPHTPRFFLELLKNSTCPGGWLLLDTPNLTWYWNHKKFASGQSVHAPIEQQFNSEIPFTGHHREYTGSELAYMLEKTGLTEIFIKYFDYNCLQYKTLGQNHVEYVWSIIEQPEQAGIILAGGQRPR